MVYRHMDKLHHLGEKWANITKRILETSADPTFLWIDSDGIPHTDGEILGGVHTGAVVTLYNGALWDSITGVDGGWMGGRGFSFHYRVGEVIDSFWQSDQSISTWSRIVYTTAIRQTLAPIWLDKLVVWREEEGMRYFLKSVDVTESVKYQFGGKTAFSDDEMFIISMMA